MRTTSMISMAIVAAACVTVMAAPTAPASTGSLVARGVDLESVESALKSLGDSHTKGHDLTQVNQEHLQTVVTVAKDNTATNENRAKAFEALRNLKDSPPLETDSDTVKEARFVRTVYNSGRDHVPAPAVKGKGTGTFGSLSTGRKVALGLGGAGLVILGMVGITEAVKEGKEPMTDNDITKMIDYANQNPETSTNPDPRPAIYESLVTFQAAGLVTDQQITDFENGTGYDPTSEDTTTSYEQDGQPQQQDGDSTTTSTSDGEYSSGNTSGYSGYTGTTGGYTDGGNTGGNTAGYPTTYAKRSLVDLD